MRALALTITQVVLVAVATSSSVQARRQIETVSEVQLSALNRTVGGRLRTARPISLPCYSTFEGKYIHRDKAACAVVEASYTDPTFRVDHFGAYQAPQWETCQSTSEQCLLDNTNLTNSLAWETRNCSQGSVPSYYIDIHQPSDVTAALAFADLTGVALVVKNSGHDYKGRSSMKGALGLWTHNLRGKSYNPKFVPTGCPESTSYPAMTIGAGEGWQDVYEWAGTLGITAVGGYHQTVGASGGWLTGGGHSILSPVFGLGVDRVVQFRIVTPDGILRVANVCQNQDLFWALRGGGGNALGVVMESTSIVEPRPIPLQVASINFTANETASMAGWLKILVDSSLKWGTEGWGGHMGPSSLINVTPLLDLSQAQASLAEVSAYAKSYGGSVAIETLPSWTAFFNKYVIAAQAPVGRQLTLGSRLLPSRLFGTEHGRAQLLDILVNMLPHTSPYIVVSTPHLHKRLPGLAGDTAVTPAWYNSLWHLAAGETWTFNATLTEKIGIYTDVSKNLADSLRRVAPDSGSYFNEGDVYESDHTRSFWGANYERLLAVKNKYDPARLMDCWQCVGWTGPTNDKFTCYPRILSPQ